MKHLHSLSDRQRRLTVILLTALTALALLLAGETAVGKFLRVVAAQEAISGQWTAQYEPKWRDQVQLNMIRRSDKGGTNMMGNNYRLDELRGLDAGALMAADTIVKFAIVGEAGTINFEGSFKAGRGAGFWTFSPNAAFASAMSQRGFPNLTDEDLLRATTHNLTIKYIDEMKSVGFANLDFDLLVRGAGHEVSLAYINELKSAGYPGLTMDELIRARNHEIDGAYIKEVRAMGFEKETMDSVIRLKNHEITSAYLAEMKAAGFGDLTLEDTIRLKNHDITQAYVSEIRGEGYNELSADTAIRLKNHDVNADFIRKAKAQGYANASLEDLIRLSSRGTIK